MLIKALCAIAAWLVIAFVSWTFCRAASDYDDELEEKQKNARSELTETGVVFPSGDDAI